jgi:hypothetical protein
MASTLENNTSTLESLITAINNLPDASGGNGNNSGVNTCTVHVTTTDAESPHITYGYVAYQNGEYIIKEQILFLADLPITFSDVICGSCIYVGHQSASAGYSTATGTAQLAGSSGIILIQAPVVPDEVATVTLTPYIP